MLPPVLLAAFPDLDDAGGVVTHPPDPAYNIVQANSVGLGFIRPKGATENSQGWSVRSERNPWVGSVKVL